MWRRVAAWLVDASTLLGVLTFATGGYWRHSRGHGPEIDLTYFGPYFLPIALCLMFGVRPGGYALPLLLRAQDSFERLAPRMKLLWVAGSLVGFTVAHSGAVYLRYASFQAGMDLAIYGNACRNALFSTMKGDVWLLADHFEPLLMLFVPLCRRFDPAVVLLIVQEIGFGVGAAGMYALARARLWSASLSWLLAALYLSFAGNVTVAYYDFHLLALALAFVPWLWWALETERYALALVLGVAFMGLKESVPLTVVGIGAYLLVKGPTRGRLLGAGFVIAGALTFFAIMKLVYPWFRHGEETMYFAKYYGHLGHNLGEFTQTIVTRPLYFLSTLVTADKLEYLARLLAPFLFLPVVRPLYLVPILPALFINIASNDSNMLSLSYHYEAEIYPTLFVVALFGFGEARLRNVWLAAMLVLFSAPSAMATARRSRPNEVQKHLAAQLEQRVPHDVAVAAPQRLAAHLTRIPKLYMFDYWQMEQDWKRADVVVVGYPGYRLGWYGWPMLEYMKLPRMLPLLRLTYQDPTDPRIRMYEVIHDGSDHVRSALQHDRARSALSAHTVHAALP